MQAVALGHSRPFSLHRGVLVESQIQLRCRWQWFVGLGWRATSATIACPPQSRGVTMMWRSKQRRDLEARAIYEKTLVCEQLNAERCNASIDGLISTRQSPRRSERTAEYEAGGLARVSPPKTRAGGEPLLRPLYRFGRMAYCQNQPRHFTGQVQRLWSSLIKGRNLNSCSCSCRKHL